MLCVIQIISTKLNQILERHGYIVLLSCILHLNRSCFNNEHEKGSLPWPFSSPNNESNITDQRCLGNKTNKTNRQSPSWSCAGPTEPAYPWLLTFSSSAHCPFHQGETSSELLMDQQLTACASWAGSRSLALKCVSDASLSSLQSCYDVLHKNLNGLNQRRNTVEVSPLKVHRSFSFLIMQ